MPFSCEYSPDMPTCNHRVHTWCALQASHQFFTTRYASRDACMSSVVSRALVLYGRVGTYKNRAADLPQSALGDEVLWRRCADSIDHFVVAPWRRAGHLDIFVQSWNPELAEHMDHYWRPRASDHAAQNTSIGKCPVSMPYCTRTLWTLLGMKRALALRSQWSARANSADHAIVLVMRHDLQWSAELPSLRADGPVRLWMPFNCLIKDCHVSRSSKNSEKDITKTDCGKKNNQPSNWSMVVEHETQFGRSCHQNPYFCANTVNVDLWWAGDAALANDFGRTFDEFEAYSKKIQYVLRFPNSTPHHFWGLFFFDTHRLRDKCQVGFATAGYIDFTIGRFSPGDAYLTRKMEGWHRQWSPPVGSCNASLIDGYVTMCPDLPGKLLLTRYERGNYSDISSHRKGPATEEEKGPAGIFSAAEKKSSPWTQSSSGSSMTSFTKT